MSQERPRRPQDVQQEPIKYGDVFEVSGDLAEKPIGLKDATRMQTAEATVFGETQKSGAAVVMLAAAIVNERAGLVGSDEVADVTGDIGVTVTATDYGTPVITESIAGQVVGQYYESTQVQQQQQTTIGEALEATAHIAGNKAVDKNDAAAIQAAEVRATGSNVITPGGVAAAAQSEASFNAGLDRDEDKIKLTHDLTGATVKLPADKAPTREDADRVTSAELRNNPNLETHPGGVAASVAAAARFNEGTI
ncbi:hypothetical protein LOK49_LG06G03018 [Camellia lanceoleosa]|uniref:Uncharacterized protein n=1 Tax=Camellia lanceoleosa TaxID=1840588 RepID=A0ACC0H9G1_9ERIC|nr:hypothetical protein LOK49_LG06G03018 [Camellia lanceoleosa]